MTNTVEEGQAAKKLLQNPLLAETLTTIESALIDQWKVTSSPDIREEVWYTLMGLKRFTGILEAAVESGEAEKLIKENFNE